MNPAELVNILVPRNVPDVVALVLASIGAILCALGPAAFGKKSSPIQKTPRYQSYLWLFGSSVPTLMVNWKAISFAAPIDQAQIFATYLMWAAMVVAITNAVVVIGIVFEARGANVPSRLRAARWELAVRFVKDGWEACLADKYQLHAAADDAKAASQEETLKIFAGLALRLLNQPATADASARAYLATDVMMAIKKELLKFAEDQSVTLNLNYLRAVPWQRHLESEDRDRAIRFDFAIPGVPREQRYSHLLVLHCRLEAALGQDICIGVSGPANPLTKEALLPGAPQAVACGRPVYLQRKKGAGFPLTFGAPVPAAGKVPQNIRQEVVNFFNGLDCNSLLSIPLVKGERGTEVTGVLNVESSLYDLLGNKASAQEIAQLIDSFCKILSHVV